MAYQGAIFDVDGVLVDSPHGLAWRDALRELMEGEWRDIRDQTSWTAERFTPGVPAGHGGQAADSRRPRRAGALRRARRGAGGPSSTRPPSRSTSCSSSTRAGSWPFPTRCGSSWPSRTAGIRVAAASSSKNAKLFLERIRLDTFAAEQRLDYGFVREGMTLEDLFDADISGRDLAPRQARPDDLPDRRGGARAFPGGVFRHRGRRPVVCRPPRPAEWRRSASPASATSDSWPTRAPTWS